MAEPGPAGCTGGQEEIAQAVEDIQDQAELGPEQPDLFVAVPFHCRGVGLDELQRSLPTQMIQ